MKTTQSAVQNVNNSVTTDFSGLSLLVDALKNVQNRNKYGAEDVLKNFAKNSKFHDLVVCGPDGLGVTAAGNPVNMYNYTDFKTLFSEPQSVSLVQDDDTGKPLILFSMQIMEGNRPLAVVCAFRDAGYLTEALDVASVEKDTQAYIIDDTSKFIANPSNDDASKDSATVFELINTAKNSYRDIDGFMYGLKNGVAASGEVFSRGILLTYSYAPIKGLNGWFYLTTIPSQVIDIKNGSMMNAVISLVILTFMLAAFAFFAVIFINNKRHKKLIFLAHTDQLTGIANWNKFSYECDSLLKTTSKQKRAIVSLDVDGFNVINDNFGYDGANKLLIAIAKQLQSATMLGERCCRESTDVFYEMLMYDNDNDIMSWVNSFDNLLHSTFTEYPFAMRYGVFTIQDSNTPIDMMCDKANLARRSLKKGDIGNLAFYKVETSRHILATKEIEKDMAGALEKRQFVVYFQPKHNMQSKDIVAVEALVRWAHPDKGLLFPDAFIDVFESNGFITQLDMYVFEESCKQLKEWWNTGIEMKKVAINMSVANLSNSNYLHELTRIISRYSIPPHYIEIEFSEKSILDKADKFVEVVELLKRCGFHVAIDKCCSTYTSVTLLLNVDIDTIKLDSEFVKKCLTTKKGQKVLKTAIEVAKSFNVATVCMGIETREQESLVIEAGGVIGQGYLYSHPLSAGRLEEYIKIPYEN